MDALVVWCYATVLTMNDRLLPPATIVPPATGRGHSLPVAFLPLIERSVPDDMLRNTVAEAAALLLGRRVCLMRWH